MACPLGNGGFWGNCTTCEEKTRCIFLAILLKLESLEHALEQVTKPTVS